MKFIIIFSIILLSYYTNSSCQCVDYKDGIVWVVIRNDSVLNKKRLKSTNLKLYKTFKKYEVDDIKQVFPFTKDKILKNLYQLNFKGSTDDFINKINNYKEFEEIIKRPKDEKISLYEPSDWMWQAHKEDWLWHLDIMEADKAWDITKGDPNIIVASLDTWFDINHPDLKEKIIYNYDPYSGTPYSSDCRKNHHGTSVVSYIAAHTDGGGDLAAIGFKCRMICYQAWAGNYLQRAHHASLKMKADIITSSAGGWF